MSEHRGRFIMPKGMKTMMLRAGQDLRAEAKKKEAAKTKGTKDGKAKSKTKK